MMKKIWISLIVCLCMLAMPSVAVRAAESDIIRNDESGIPDEALYKGILKRLGKKSNETFTRQEAESLEELDVGGDIRSLKGIGNLSQLERLCIMSKELRSLKGVESLYKLEELDIPYNKVKSLKPLKSLTNLQSLMVESCQLTSLRGIENLKNLMYLNVVDNRISSLKPLANLTNITTLSIYNNNLKSLNGIENLANLTTLDVGGNELTSVKGIEKLTNLSVLEIGGNKLTSVNEIKRLKKLEKLDISHNKIKKLPNLKNFKKLTWSSLSLSIRNNRLTEKEIRQKLPARFFKKGKARKQWLKEQTRFQNLDCTVKLIKPSNTKKINKNTKRIVGRVGSEMKDVYVELRCLSMGVGGEKVKVDENGVFVFDNLNLKRWAGSKVQFRLHMMDDNGEDLLFIGGDTVFYL